jgi:hypothetical protein
LRIEATSSLFVLGVCFWPEAAARYRCLLETSVC